MTTSASRVLLRRGLVFDGAGNEPFTADVLLEGGRIAACSRAELDVEGAERIDATGCWVMPGFVDVHTHYDAEVLAAPELFESLRHGVTTVFLGSCGLSMVMGEAEDLSDMFTRVEGVPREQVLPLLRELKRWQGPAAYLDALRGLGLGPNVAVMLGHSDLRSGVMGLARSLQRAAPDESDLKRMDAVLEEALDAGFVGLSVNTVGLDKMDGARFRSEPTPSTFASMAEYARLFEPVRRRGRVVQAVPGPTSMWTNTRLLAKSGGLFRPGLKMSLLTMVDTKAFRGAHRLIGAIASFFNRVLRADLRVQAVPHHFDMWVDGIDTPLFEEMPSGSRYIHLTDPVAKRRLLEEPAFRRAFVRQLGRKLMPRMFHRDLTDTRIVECDDASLVGLSFAEVAANRGRPTGDTFLDVVAEHRVRWQTTIGNDREDELAWILAHSTSQIGFGDAGAHLRNMGLYNFPLRMLRFVKSRLERGRPSISLARAVHKLTGELADWFGVDAGHLEPGRRADVVVVDPAALGAEVDQLHEVPMAAFGGLRRLARRNDAAVPYVFVGGQLAARQGRSMLEGRRAGTVLAAGARA